MGRSLFRIILNICGYKNYILNNNYEKKIYFSLNYIYSFNLRERGNVSIKLYNLSGELVADLLNQTQDIGIQNNNARLPEGLAKGLYMVRLSLNGQASTQKLMAY